MEDWESGEMVTIALDRAVAPSETAAALYRVARKQGRTGEAIAPIVEVSFPGPNTSGLAKRLVMHL